MFSLALGMGFFGSLHCIGMCGPIVMTLTQGLGLKYNILVYHFGRILSYVLLGFFFASIGYLSFLIEIQQFFSIVIGVALVLVYSVIRIRKKVEKYYYQSSFFCMIQNMLSQNISKNKKWFISGFFNGFLPCGLTYVAVANALVVGDGFKGVLFMLLFGLGTVPALLLVSFRNQNFGKKIKKILPRPVSLLATLSGCILIFRGVFLTFPEFETLLQNASLQFITMCGF